MIKHQYKLQWKHSDTVSYRIKTSVNHSDTVSYRIKTSVNHSDTVSYRIKTSVDHSDTVSYRIKTSVNHSVIGFKPFRPVSNGQNLSNLVRNEQILSKTYAMDKNLLMCQEQNQTFSW